MTKGLASHLKYCYGACVKRNRHLTPQQLGIKVRNILNHICDDHANCDSAWCYDKKAIEEKKSYKAPADHRLQKEKHPETYLQLQQIFNQYASDEIMAFCNHPYDTKTNEALNQAIANAAPKSVCYSNSISLYACIALIISIHNLGHLSLFSELFRELGVLMTPTLARFLEQKETKKITKRKYDRRVDVKVKRSRKQKKQWLEVYKERTDQSYGPGVAVITEISSTMKEKN